MLAKAFKRLAKKTLKTEEKLFLHLWKAEIFILLFNFLSGAVFSPDVGLCD